MKRLIAFECNSSEELYELIKKATKEVLSENIPEDKPSACSQLKLLSTKEVCALLRVSVPTLIKYRRTGGLIAKRVGGKMLYKETDINKFLKK